MVGSGCGRTAARAGLYLWTTSCPSLRCRPRRRPNGRCARPESGHRADGGCHASGPGPWNGSRFFRHCWEEILPPSSSRSAWRWADQAANVTSGRWAPWLLCVWDWVVVMCVCVRERIGSQLSRCSGNSANGVGSRLIAPVSLDWSVPRIGWLVALVIPGAANRGRPSLDLWGSRERAQPAEPQSAGGQKDMRVHAAESTDECVDGYPKLRQEANMSSNATICERTPGRLQGRAGDFCIRTELQKACLGGRGARYSTGPNV